MAALALRRSVHPQRRAVLDVLLVNALANANNNRNSRNNKDTDTSESEKSVMSESATGTGIGTGIRTTAVAAAYGRVAVPASIAVAIPATLLAAVPTDHQTLQSAAAQAHQATYHSCMCACGCAFTNQFLMKAR